MECNVNKRGFLCILADLQNVDITLRVLLRPKEEKLPWIYANIGVDFDERVLPSITTEVLKSVVVRYHSVLCALMFFFRVDKIKYHMCLYFLTINAYVCTCRPSSMLVS